MPEYLVLLCGVFPVFFSLAVPSPSPELQRLPKFHLALIPTLQQGDLVNVDLFVIHRGGLSPVGVHESQGHKPDWLFRQPARGQPAQQVARGQTLTCQTAQGSPETDYNTS